jgi:hypothetical protein
MTVGSGYAATDAAPDQYVIESWIGALPDSSNPTFTRSVRDFAAKFARQEGASGYAPRSAPATITHRDRHNAVAPPRDESFLPEIQIRPALPCRRLAVVVRR